MRIWKISQSQTIGPVYHGTVYKFDPQHLRGNPIFFSDDRFFAYDYASQKSFEGKMDADITVVEAYISGNVFDPQNEENVRHIVSYLPDTITIYNDFGMEGHISVDSWAQMINGISIQQPYWSEEDLVGKSPGDFLPENDTYGKPLKYQLIELTPDKVYYIRRGFIGEIQNGKYTFYHSKERQHNMGRSTDEIINDLKTLDELDFIKKYGLYNDLYFLPKIFYRSRQPVTTYDNDVWRLLEGDEIMETINQVGFDIIKSRERGATTYAVFNTAEIKVIS